MEEKLEQPTETCGLMVTFEGGVAVKVNLKATKQRVIEKIQDHLSKGRQNLVQFETANPDEEEVCMIDPKRILLMLLKKEFIMQSGRIVSASMASPGVPPQKFEH
jgi:hypothetical protein